MKKSDIILGFLVGASAGALLGLLLAPDKGIKTRRKLYKKGELAIGDIKDGAYILSAYVNEVNNEIDLLSDKVDAALEQAADEATLRIGKAITKFAEKKWIWSLSHISNFLFFKNLMAFASSLNLVFFIIFIRPF